MKTQNTIQKIQSCKTNKDKLKLLVDLCPSGYLMYLKNPAKFNIVELVDWLISSTPKLDDPVYTLQTKVFWVLNDIVDFPKCIICGNPLTDCNVKSAQKGYKDLVCSNALCHRKLSSKRRCQTMIENHGYAGNFQNPSAMDKIRRTNIEKYGNACPANNKDIRDRIDAHNIEKYGVKSYSSTQECKDKVKATNLKNLGVDNPFKSDECKAKARSTMIEKYGVDHPLRSQEIREKIEARHIEKYGENYRQIIWGNRGNIGQSRRSYNEFILNSSKVKPLFSLDEFIEKRKNNEVDLRFECKKCHHEFISDWNDGMTKSCPYCMNSGSSNEEQEIYSYLLEMLPNDEIHHNDRTVLDHLELDFYIPSKQLAIEFDGLFWHNDDIQLNYRYHLNKTEQCESNGIQLVHIFENEWQHKQSIVKSRIKNLLGMHDTTIFARKCSVVKLANDDAKTFLAENHIQGSINASLHYGLMHNGVIVAAMSFGKSRFSKKYEWEMLRFCTKLGHHIPGGASRLLKHFEGEAKPRSLVSYADRRWSAGHMYKQLGFTLDHASAPDYWYFNDYSTMVLKSRMQFQKHMLKNILSTFDESKTEVENMKINGYHRIFDCGNLVFVKTYSF